MSLDRKTRFIEIAEFLKKYQELHENEFLKKYPTEYPDFLLPWINELYDWDLEQMAQLESYPHEDLVKNLEFKTYLKEVRSLCAIDKVKTYPTALSFDLSRKLKPKKKHEIESLKTLVNEIKEVDTVIDIGGGVGHLSCALINGTNKKAICIDQDEKLQELGRLKIKDWLQGEKENINFVKMSFTEKSQIVFDPQKSALMGIHSCGYLSVDIIKQAIKTKVAHLINFGCCYHFLDENYQQSVFSKLHNPALSTSALNLAGRSYSIVTKEDLEDRFHFKKFRYMLHYYQFDNFKIPFHAIGKRSKLDYGGSFFNYAQKRGHESIQDKMSEQELNSYYEKEENFKKFKINYIADTIRLLLGRVIEIYIIFDRAFYLEENGYNVIASEFFDRGLSPRNIMIYATIQEKSI